MPDFEISPGLKIHYLDPNPDNNPAVLLLHGLGATGDSWQLQIPVLAENALRAIAPDARGFGQSTYPGGKISAGKMAGDMVALLNRMNIERAYIVGISMGGALALQLALDYPGRVAKLVLVNTFAHLKPDNASQFFYFWLRQILMHTVGLAKQGEAVTKRVFPHPDQELFRRELYNQIMQADPRAYRAAMSGLARFNVVNRLGEIEIPTLVITGENDTTVAPQRQRFLAESIPNARQVVIPNAGHAVSVDQAQTFNQALIEFLL
jgi:3-oxoadipate enol-lactonase